MPLAIRARTRVRLIQATPASAAPTMTRRSSAARSSTSASQPPASKSDLLPLLAPNAGGHADGQAPGRDVAVDHGAGARPRSGAHLDRGHQHRVAAYESAVADHRAVLADAVVVAGDRPCPYVHAVP